jgi:UDP-glucose 4-epimerase
MTGKRVVLVTGVAGFWGSLVAARLVSQPELHVIGLDDDPPADEIKGLDFIQADIRNPLLTDLLRDEQVDTVCHLAFVDSTRPNEQAFDVNVMGTMQVLAACGAASVRKIILKSSTTVYGALATNSAFLRENQPLNGSRGYGHVRDLVEIEAFCNGFRGQNPDVILTVLRFAHIVGPKCDTPLTRFLREEEALVLLGFDPMTQVIHEADVAAALVYAVQQDAPGVFNVAAEGIMPLWRLMGLAGKVAVPVFHPLAYLAVSLFGPRTAPIDVDYLRYPCVADLQKMRQELKFVPQYTADEALREFAAQQRLRSYLPASAARAYDEERLRDTLERRRRAREQAAASTDGSAGPAQRAAPAAKRTRGQGKAKPARRPDRRAPEAPPDTGNGEPAPVAMIEEKANG